MPGDGGKISNLERLQKADVFRKKENSMKEKEFCYGEEGQERLDCDPEDTFDNFMSNIEDGEEISYPVKVLEFRRIEVTLRVDSILDSVLESLDEEYGDPDGDYTTPTKKMKEAAEVFAKEIISEYYSWMCELTGNYYAFDKDGKSTYWEVKRDKKDTDDKSNS